MAAYADRVRETTTTTGTGTYSLAGAVEGFRTFVAGAGGGAVVTYVAENGVDWEIGEGTVTDAATDTVSRTTIIASSNAGAAVNWTAGTKNIFLTLSAARTVTTDKSNSFTANVAASSTSTGTLVVTGGVGVSGNVHVGGTLVGNVSGTATNITGVAAVANGGTGAANASAARTNLGVAIGSNVQAWDAHLDQIAALSATSDNFIVGNGTSWITETPSAARTSLGLGTIATQDSSSVTIAGGTINSTSIGATTRSTGAFTTLTSNAATTFTANTSASSTTTGTLVVTGGLGVSGNIHVGGLMVGVATSAQYADLAENYRADAAYEP